MKRLLVGFLAVLVLLLAVVAYAQISPPPGEPRPRPGPGILPLPGSAPAMQVDGDHLYILRGNHLMRVHKVTLSVDRETILPAPQPPQPQP